MNLPVVESVPVWLPQTQTWLYDEVRFLPPDIEPHVVCEQVENLDQFPAAHLHCVRRQPKWRSVLDLGVRKLGLRQHLAYTARVTRESGARLLHSHFGYTGWADMSAVAEVGVRHIVTFYGIDVNHMPEAYPRWRERYRELFSAADRILAEGEFMAAAIVRLGCPAEKVQVFRLGVDVDAIPFQPRVWDPATPFRVLVAASFREKKGIPYAVKAVARLLDKVPVELTIIGDAHAGEASQAEKRHILDAVEKGGLSDVTRMPGYVTLDQLRRESLTHHVFLSPSVTAADGDTEGGAPVGLIEMAASGMPLVSTRHCDIPGVIVDGATGWLADERDVDGLTAHLRWLINNPGEWEEVLSAGRQRMEAEFNARIQGQRLGDIYREVLNA